MTDEFDIVHISHDETQGIIDWAVSAAAMAIFMDAVPNNPKTLAEAKKIIASLLDAVKITIDNMPETLVGPAQVLAVESYDEAVYEQEQVDMFLQEIEEL